MMGQQTDLFCIYSSEQLLCNRISDPAAHSCHQRPNPKAAGIVSGPNDKPHQNAQVVMLIGPPNHASPRTFTHLMPLLELRHVQPDEALCGKKQESNRQEGRGRVKEDSISNTPLAFRPHQLKIIYPILRYILSGSLPPFLFTLST